MRKGILASLIALAFIFVSVSPALATSPVQNITPVPGFGFPDSIVAGDTYTARYSFENKADGHVSFFVNMNVSNKIYPVNYKEFFVSMWINSKALNCSEKRPGRFYCYNRTSEFSVAKNSSNELYINFSSVPNLFPDSNYNFTVDFLTLYPVPVYDVLFAQGTGEYNKGKTRLSGQAKIYTDEGRAFMKIWIKDRRTNKEYSEEYEVRSRYKTWYGEEYYCASKSKQILKISVYFKAFVYASGKDIYFMGKRA